MSCLFLKAHLFTNENAEMIFINCFVFARNMKLNFNSFWIVYLQEAEEKKTNFNLNSNRCSEIAAFEMTLVGFSYEYECTSNWEQSMTLFSLSPQVFAITWPPKKKTKNKSLLFQTIILSTNMHVSSFWTPKTRTQRWPTAWTTWQRKVSDCCYWSPWETLRPT